MPFGFDIVPNMLDGACGADQETATHNPQERFAQEFLHAPGPEGLNHFEFGIAEQREVEFVFLLEAGLGFDGVAAGSQDDGIQLVELLLCVTKLGRFDGSTGSVGFGKEKEQHFFAAKVGQGDVFAVVALDLEIRRFIPSFQHFPHLGTSEYLFPLRSFGHPLRMSSG